MSRIKEIAVHEGKTEKVLFFAMEGKGMSKRWWRDTHKLQENGCLGGIYQTKSGKLRDRAMRSF